MTADTVSLAAELIRALRDRKGTVAVAESCTGGMIGAALTAVPGSSAVFLGGVISYANSVKRDLVGVPQELLERFGAVSAEVAGAMAEGVRRLTGATCAVAVSGVAGPDGGTAEKPVGLVWVGVAAGLGTATFEHRFAGGRAEVRRQAVDAALRHVLDSL